MIIMKVLILALFLVAVTQARSSVKQSQINVEFPKCPIDDPLLRDGPLPINVTLHPILSIVEGSQITNLVVEDLSTLWYKIDLNALLLTATFELKLDRVTGNATYSANGYVDARPFRQETIPSGNFTGSGLGKVSATGVELKGNLSLFISIAGKVEVRRLNIEIAKCHSASFDLGTDFTIGGSQVDWTSLSASFKANFDKDLADNKADITEKVRVAANEVLGKYTLEEIYELIHRPANCATPESYS